MAATLNPFKRDPLRYVLFGLFILGTRLPFFLHGYGVDSDAWGVALTAKFIAESGQYSVSRFPGYPFQELVLSLLYKGGPFLFNLVTALMSVAGVIFFALTLRKLRFKYIFLAGTTLAFVPTIFINSTISMDYIWAFAFLMASMYFIIINKPIVAGIMLGLAIGCRITSGAMLLPYAIMLLRSDYSGKNMVKEFLFIVSALVMGGLCFLPVYLKYGTSFFTYYDVPYPSIPKVLYKFTFDVWGVLGFFGLCCSVLMLFAPTKHKVRQYLFPRRVNINYVLPWLIAIDLYIISFIVLPMESGYLIPLIPFVILIFGKYLYDKAFVFFAWTIILSPFVGGISAIDREDAPKPAQFEKKYLEIGGERLAFDPFTGPLITYQLRKESGQAFVEEVIQSADTLKINAIIVSGKWYNQVILQWKEPAKSFARFAPYIMHDELHDAFDRGCKVYYLPQAEVFNHLKAGFNLDEDGAIPFVKTPHAKD